MVFSCLGVYSPNTHHTGFGWNTPQRVPAPRCLCPRYLSSQALIAWASKKSRVVRKVVIAIYVLWVTWLRNRNGGASINLSLPSEVHQPFLYLSTCTNGMVWGRSNITLNNASTDHAAYLYQVCQPKPKWWSLRQSWNNIGHWHRLGQACLACRLALVWSYAMFPVLFGTIAPMHATSGGTTKPSSHIVRPSGCSQEVLESILCNHLRHPHQLPWWVWKGQWAKNPFSTRFGKTCAGVCAYAFDLICFNVWMHSYMMYAMGRVS